MSLHHLGMAQFTLHRPVLSPTASSFSGSAMNPDLNQDNKDVLIERLSDLVLRLSKDELLEDTAISILHADVDRIERHMRAGSRRRSEGIENMMQPRDDDSFWGSRSPSHSLRMRLPRNIRNSSRKSIIPEPSDITPSKAIEVARAAEELAFQLTSAVSDLQTRKQESDHIHDLLIARVEKFTERILLLEYRIAEMQDDFEANQSELKFLRIQLQAIEAQCSPYIPQNEDQELSESIMNWKIDWEDINKRSEKRRSHQMSVLYSNDSTTQDAPRQGESSQISVQNAT